MFQISFQGSNRGIFIEKCPFDNFLAVQPTFADIRPIVSDRQVSTEKLTPHHPFYRVSKTANINGKKLLSLQPVVRTQESWTYKTAKIFSRTRHLESCSVNVLTNASKLLWDIIYYMNYRASDQ